MARTLAAVVVRGDRNDTRITFPQELTEASLARMARSVAEKDPGRTYYVVAMTERRRGFVKGDVMYVWHVGDGFVHHEGWWVEAGQ